VGRNLLQERGWHRDSIGEGQPPRPRGFIDALENAYNSIAVEPISIKHEKDLLGKATWEFNKPAEMIVRQRSSDQPKPSEDPLDQLKMKFIRGEISEEEYKAKLRLLQEK